MVHLLVIFHNINDVLMGLKLGLCETHMLLEFAYSAVLGRLATMARFFYKKCVYEEYQSYIIQQILYLVIL